ncbi:DUF6796 family protein [Microbispora sp. ZYX-F-249]|uniref:DUF6796 family protein n=1 Tax=Microbispora maris TaxID=3144104 RepID=A0ABV0ANK5_9ACTN
MTDTLTNPTTPVTREPASGTAVKARRLTAAALVGGALLNGAESIGMRYLLPPKPEAAAAKLQMIADTGARYPVLVTLGTLAVPLMCAGFLTLSRLVGRRAPRTGRAAAALLLTGMFGFFGMHVLALAQVPLSRSADPAQAGALLDMVEKDALLGVLFTAPFLAGCALGMLVLVAGLLRTGALPRWIPLTLLAFLVVDFGLGNGGPVDAHWLFVAACLGAARAILTAGKTPAIG